jgi:uncharacterized protein
MAMILRTKRTDLELKRRTVAFKAETVDDAAGTFKGYASVFGNVDNGRDVVAKGAFAECLAEWKQAGDPMPVLWQHMWTQPIGGSDVLQEDEKGLYTEGWLLTADIPQAKIAHTLMKRRVVKGMSIGYYVLADSWNEKERIMTLTKLELVEYSIVTFPMNSEAQVDDVKSKIAKTCDTIRDFERFLRDEGGFSAGHAKRLASGGWPAFAKARDEQDSEGTKKVLETFEALRSFQL